MNMQEQFDNAAKPFAFETVTAAELQTKTFAPIKWIVPDLLPEGLTLLCGKPKLGKSWMALDFGCAVALGASTLGKVCEAGPVLYLALEDNQRRLKKRLAKIHNRGAWPADLHLATESPRLDAGGLLALRDWCDCHPNARLLILDTLATVKPANTGRQSDYAADYAALRGLHALAGELGIAIVVVHHVRKAEADDPFDTVSGSTGLTGAADTTLILTKRAGDGGTVRYGRGRDLAEVELAVEFNTDVCRWTELGLPSEAFASDTRKRILDAMRQGTQSPLKISDVSGVEYELAKKTLQRMASAGEVNKNGHGLYELPRDPL